MNYEMTMLLITDQLLELDVREKGLTEQLARAKNPKQITWISKALANVHKWQREMKSAIELLKQHSTNEEQISPGQEVAERLS